MTHPLVEKQMYRIENWFQWKDLWNETKHAELLHSLLHFGFDVPANQDEQDDRVLFYLMIADGYLGDGRNFQKEEDAIGPTYPGTKTRFIDNSWSEIRRKLARKAFETLCQHHFKMPSHRSAEPEYRFFMDSVSEHVHVAITKFFYGTGGRLGAEPGLRNVGRVNDDHHSEVARTFLLKMIEFTWRRTDKTEQEKAMKTRLRPTFIEIMDGLGNLDVLLSTGSGACPPDDTCLAKLAELALTQKRYFPLEGRKRVPKTVEEACYAGSEAAKTLLLLRNRQIEEKRLAEIHG